MLQLLPPTLLEHIIMKWQFLISKEKSKLGTAENKQYREEIYCTSELNINTFQ